MKNSKHKIVLVDDDEQILKALCREFRSNTREIASFIYPEEAISYLSVNRVDIVVSDYRMPEMNGVDFLTKVKKVQPETIRIILSGNPDLEFLKNAINEVGIYRFLAKPWDSFQLQTAISHALEFKDLTIENKILADEVRQKNDYIQKQKDELERLEQMQPGITQVNWDDDGAIVINEENI